MRHLQLDEKETRRLLDTGRLVLRRPIKYKAWDGTKPIPLGATYCGVKGGRHTWEFNQNTISVLPPQETGIPIPVREIWREVKGFVQTESGRASLIIGYQHKADGHTIWKYDCTAVSAPSAENIYLEAWMSPVKMPNDALRLYAVCEELRAERISDITDQQATTEGYADRLDYLAHWNLKFDRPMPVRSRNLITHYESFPWENWKTDMRHKQGCPWIVTGDPWCWVIELHRR